MIDRNLIIIISCYTQSTLLPFFSLRNQIYVLHGGNNNTHPQQRENKSCWPMPNKVHTHELKSIWQKRVAIYCYTVVLIRLHNPPQGSFLLPVTRVASMFVQVNDLVFQRRDGCNVQGEYDRAVTQCIMSRATFLGTSAKVSLDPFSSKSYEQRSNSQRPPIFFCNGLYHHRLLQSTYRTKRKSIVCVPLLVLARTRVSIIPLLYRFDCVDSICNIHHKNDAVLFVIVVVIIIIIITVSAMDVVVVTNDPDTTTGSHDMSR